MRRRGALRRRRGAEEPEKEVDVVARFCEEGGSCGGFFSPVAADVAVAEMPPTYGLCVLYGDDVANHAVFEKQLSKKHVVRAVTQDMANAKDCSGLTVDGI